MRLIKIPPSFGGGAISLEIIPMTQNHRFYAVKKFHRDDFMILKSIDKLKTFNASRQNFLKT